MILHARPAFDAPVRVSHRKTTVSWATVWRYSAVSMQCWRVLDRRTDRRTDGHRAIAYTSIA